MATMNILQFQGTSSTGNFQAALDKAISQALEALSINVADQRIQWKMIEISGSEGGFSGEHSVTVTIEAQVN